MAVYEVFSQSVSLKYKSTLCSKSTFFSFFISFLTITLPFLLGYRSHGFWLKSSSYREQPKVNFKHDYLLYIETDQLDSPVLCSNMPITQEFNYCTMIKSREEDSNQDGYYDKLFMEIEVELPSNLSVFSVQLVLIFDYILQKQYLLQMESVGFLQFNSALPLSGLSFAGDLRLVQKQLLGGRGRDTRYNTSVFGLTDDPTTMLNLNDAMKNYGQREVTTSIENLYQTWTRGMLLHEPFTITLDITYPEITIYYRPSISQVLKWAWMQYLALLIIFLYISQFVKSYVFSNHLVPTLKEIPWKKAL